MNEDFINIEQASQLLGLKVGTIYGKCHKREIPYYKRGSILLFSKKELEKWIMDGRVPTNEEVRESLKTTKNQPIRRMF